MASSSYEDPDIAAKTTPRHFYCFYSAHRITVDQTFMEQARKELKNVGSYDWISAC